MGKQLIGTRGPNIAMVPTEPGKEPMEVVFENGVAQVDDAIAKILLSKKYNSNGYYFIPGNEKNILDINNPTQLMEYGLQSLLTSGKYGVARDWIQNAANRVETALMNAYEAPPVGDGNANSNDVPSPGNANPSGAGMPTMVRLADGQEVPIDRLSPDGVDGGVKKSIEDQDDEDEADIEEVEQTEDDEDILVAEADDLKKLGEDLALAEKKSKKKGKKSKKGKKKKKVLDDDDE